MIIPFRRILTWIVLPCLLVVEAVAQTDVSAASPASAPPEQSTIPRIPDLFQIELPVTEQSGQVKLSFLPHFRDLLNEDYLRVPFEISWGVNDHFELNSYTDTYFDHGLRKGDGGYGISELHFGAKYAWLEWLKPTWDAGIGFNSSIPVSRPPLTLTDGHDHFTPYIVFSRKLDGVPGLSGVFNVSTDFISDSSTPGVFNRNEPHSNSFTVSPALLYDHLAWHYTLEVDCTTTRVIGSGSHDFLTVRPGVFWDLPKRLVFNAHGRWLAGFNLSFVFGPDGNTVGTGGRLRGEVNLTRWFSGGRKSDSSPAGSTPGQ